VVTITNFKFLAYPILEILPAGLLSHSMRFSKKPSPGRDKQKSFFGLCQIFDLSRVHITQKTVYEKRKNILKLFLRHKVLCIRDPIMVTIVY